MPSEPAGPAASALDPRTWTDLLVQHAAGNDMFSARTLMVIINGVEQLAARRTDPAAGLVLTKFHAGLFERLLRSFNSPVLLKEVGQAYLDLGLPGPALGHFDLARRLAPKDRDLESLQRTATLALARKATDIPTHSGLGEAETAKPEVARLLRTATTRIAIGETRSHLTEATEELRRKTQNLARVRPSIGKPDFDFAPMLRQAQDEIERTDFPRAAATLARARQAGSPVPELQPLYAQLGLAAFDHGRLPEALDAYLSVRDLDPKAIEGWFNGALVYQKMGRLDEALEAYLEAARLDPENSKTWCNLSVVHMERGDFPAAEETARRALSLRPDYPRAWDNLASVLGAVGRLAEAEQACREAIRLQPTLVTAWFKLGVVHYQQENFLAAMEAFGWTGDNPDFFPFVLYYLAMIEARRGGIEEATEKLEQARAADPKNDLEIPALREIAAACTRQARYPEAAHYYGQLVARLPEDAEAWLGRGTAFHRAEQFDEARAAYLETARLSPANPVPWHNLGLLASDLGDHEESCRCFRRETELAPDDAKAWYDLGVSLRALGREEEGEEVFVHAEGLVRTMAKRSSDLSAAMSIVHRLNLGDRMLKDR